MKFCVDSIFLFPKGLLKTEFAIKHYLWIPGSIYFKLRSPLYLQKEWAFFGKLTFSSLATQ